MVLGPRRNRSDYHLLLRSHGRSCLDRDDLDDIRAILPYLLIIINGINWLQPNYNLLILVVGILARYHELTRIINIENEVYQRNHLRAHDFSDADLYSMRIPSRATFYKIYHILNFPEKIIGDNGSVCHPEEAFLMLLWRICYPRRLQEMCRKFGREYSRISRIIRSVFLCIDNQHRHLVSNNSIRFFASRFQYYNSCFRRKYQAINGVMTPAYWSRVAVFSDGTKFYTTKNVRQNFSGHKKRYCLSMLETTGPDGSTF